MDYSEVLDISALIAPISDESPVGSDPRGDISPTSRYFSLKDIRSQARANERASLVDEDALSNLANDWRPIFEQVPEALSSEGKDLEYVAWLIEALCRLEGFPGLAVGFRLARELIENFWDSLYPLPDEDGLETRIAPLIGLNGYEGEGSLITPIVSIPITDYNGEDTFATWQFSRASEISLLDDDKQRQKADAGIATLEQIETVVKTTSPQFYVSLLADIEGAIDEFQLLSDVMDKAMEGVPQPTSTITKSLRKCRDSVKYLAGDIIEKMNTETTPEVNDNVDGDVEAEVAAVSNLSLIHI